MPTISFVVPTLNEEHTLPSLLDDLHAVDVSSEVIVVDGGSTDGTIAVASHGGAKVLLVTRSRARQMNAGARTSRGPWLCFLHADVRMPALARASLNAVVTAVDGQRLTADRPAAAVWRLAIDAAGLWPRVMEFGARIRDRLGGLPYGDQGFLIRRELFEAIGGFPDVPIMEDIAMVRAVRQRVPLSRLDAVIPVSPRRWVRQGPYRTWIRNAALVTAYLAGVSPHRLARWYRPEPSQ